MRWSLLTVVLAVGESHPGLEQCLAAADAGLAWATPFARRYVRPGKDDDFMARLAKPVLESLAGKMEEESQLERWDGVKGTALEHAEWMFQQVKDLTVSNGFSDWGTRDGIKYEIHHGFAEQAGGAGLFRLSGTIKIKPELVIALVMHAGYLGKMDPTVIHLEFLKKYSDGRTSLCLWQAAPGFPFLWRDGLDVSSYKRDADGVLWQAAVSVPNEMAEYAHSSLRAVDRYWGYKLVPVRAADGSVHTDLILVCQTTLGGWIPTFLVNREVGNVLSDYIRTVEQTGLALSSSPPADLEPWLAQLSASLL